MPKKNSESHTIYISKVHLKGFKSIEDLDVDFNVGLNILIGKNGSGKSNFMELMNIVLSFGRDNNILFEYANVEFLSNDGHTFTIELERFLRKLNIAYDNNISYDIDNVDNRIGVSEKFYIDNKLTYTTGHAEDYPKRFEFNGKKITYSSNIILTFLRMGYRNIFPTYIKFSLPANLDFVNQAGSLKIDWENPYFYNSANTLSFLYHTLGNLEVLFEESEFEEIKNITVNDIVKSLSIDNEIIDNIKSFSPIEDLRFNNNISLYIDDKTTIIDNVRIDFKINGNWLPWSQLSDGTKRLFYIITEITFGSGLILLEEPELGIHPHQFNLLMDFLKNQSLNKQIILSTHSPKALDHLDQNELSNILITNYDLKNGTQIRHLSKKELIKAKKYMKEVGFFSDYWMFSDLEE